MAKKKFVPLAQMKPGAARNKRVAQLAKNPGTRSKVPDALLPNRYKAARAAAQKVKTENATLYNPAQVLSGQDLRGAVKSAVDLEINPQLSAYDRNIKQLTGQRDVSAKRLGDYFNMYSNQASGAASALSGSAAQLAQQMSQLTQQNAGQMSGIANEIKARNAGDTALRGSGLQDPGPALNAVNFAQAQAASQSQDYLNQAATQGSGFAGLAGVAAATAGGRAQDSMSILSNKFNQQLMEMQGKRADVEAQRGPLTAKTLSEMRQQQFTNLATMKGLDLKQEDLQETVRKNKASEGLAAEALGAKTADQNADRADKLAADERRTAAKYGYNLHQWRMLGPNGRRKVITSDKGKSKGGDPNKVITSGAFKGMTQGEVDALSLDERKRIAKGKDSKGKDKEAGLTPNERSNLTGKYTSTIGDIRTNLKGAKTPPKNRNEAAQKWMSANPGSDPLAVSIALDLEYDGHVSRANARKLHRRGLTVKDLGATSYSEWKKKQGRGRNVQIPGTPRR